MADNRGITGELPIGDLLGQHLRGQGLPEDSGVSLRWVRVRFLGIPLVFPNFDARRAVLVYHDVHHLLTGYDTSWHGEGEISAFEIATGCRHYWAAWMFNLGGMFFGLCIAPRRTAAAFRRGLGARNYYGAPIDRILRTRVADARRELGLAATDSAAVRSPKGWCAFVAWSALTVALHVGVLGGVLATCWWLWTWS